MFHSFCNCRIRLARHRVLRVMQDMSVRLLAWHLVVLVQMALINLRVDKRTVLTALQVLFLVYRLELCDIGSNFQYLIHLVAVFMPCPSIPIILSEISFYSTVHPSCTLHLLCILNLNVKLIDCKKKSN